MLTNKVSIVLKYNVGIKNEKQKKPTVVAKYGIL